MLDSRTLVLFDELARELHFGRTAARLNIAQSALSAHVRRLEDLLGTTLFLRKGRSAVRLTRAGETFAKETRAALRQLERAERLGRLAGQGAAGPLTIGYIFSAAMAGVLPRVLSVAREEFPGLEIKPQLMETPEQLAAVSEGRVGLGFIRPRLTYPAGIAWQVVHREGALVAIASGHPLAECPSLAIADLVDETLILPRFADESGIIENHLQFSSKLSSSGKSIISTRDYVTAASLAAGGYGVVLAPVSLSNLGMKGLTFRPLLDFDEQLEILAIWRSGEDQPLIEHALKRLGASP
jgi:DNA-binding transcriptional LysR family regulator